MKKKCSRTSKAGLVRKLAEKYGPHHGNRWFCEKIKDIYGLDVSPSHISGILGRLRVERKIDLDERPKIKRAAEQLLRACDGDSSLVALAIQQIGGAHAS